MTTRPITLNIESSLPTQVQPIKSVSQVTNAPGPAYHSAEVAGIVTTVSFPQRRGDPTNFRIHCPNMGKTFDAVCSLFCPIRQGDTIYALCVIGPDGKLHVSKSPFVQPAIDRDSMIQCFMRAMKKGYGAVIKLYNIVSKIAGSDDSVIPFLTGIAQSWNDTRNSDILFMFHGIEPDDVKKLLNWWHRERNLRRLYLFGLTKKEINACRMTCDEIYIKCMENPYTIPAIPLEKCDNIIDIVNGTPSRDNRFRGAIIRLIWKNLHENGWTGTPTRHLSRQFPGVKDHVEALKQDYGMVAELETAYLTFPHRVEVFITDYLTNMVLSDPIKYDTPLDQRITLENGQVIERHSAHFTRELSEDQQKAIQGALDHKLCIITGGAGVGKCCQIGTPILMFDGSIKKIEEIKEGEYVMGPDSRPRRVLSKCFGMDNMYEVIPNKGRSYTFNTPHVLTLKGIQPIYKLRPEGDYIVIYTRNAVIQNKIISCLNETVSFIKSLGEDIFDVPLNEFLLWPDIRKENCRIFHVPITFPYQETPDNPYNIGLQIKENNFTHNGIPNVYKINMSIIRFNLLTGILGHRTSKICEYTEIKSNNDVLLNDIEYITLSLGFMTTRHENMIRIYDWFTGESVISIAESNKRRLDNLNQKFVVIPKGQGKYCGFELDRDGRFILGDFLVTHNTTCLGEVIHNLELRGITYAVCSFTGKAVARIREVTKKRNPSTMHRLISNTRKNQLDKRHTQFEKDIPLNEYDVVVIDEVSMVTTELLYDFLHAYPNIKRLVLVGDVNQLSPIGWGSLFQQMLKSETIPTYRLTTNYRVYTADGERDGIILNANAIISHDPQYPFEYVATTNFSVIEGPIERIYDIIRGCFSGGVRAEKLVILTPYNRCLSVLNRTFQDIYNVGARNVTDSRGVKWMIGDRVMLTENDQEIGVFNGESGNIIDITDKAILVDFGQSGCHEFLLEPTHDGRINYDQGSTVPYYRRGQQMENIMDGDEGDIDDERTVKRLLHAFALTIDKSQGSEWDFVALFIPEFNTGSFINRNRMYTAETRAKRCFWAVVSDIEAFNVASVKSPPYRCDNLSRRLTDRLPNLKPFRLAPPIPQLEMNGDLPILPEDTIPDDEMDTGFDCDDYA